MKIAFDLTQLPVEKTGIGIYAVNMVREMLRINDKNKQFHFLFFLQDDDPPLMDLLKQGDRERVTIIPIPAKRYRILPLRFYFEQISMPRTCKKLKVQAIYSFHYTMPYFTRIKRIVTIPDMTFFLFPQMHQKIKRLFFRPLIPHSLKRSDAIVTISHSAKKDILDRFTATPPQKIRVIHLGVDMGRIAEKKESDSSYLSQMGLEPGYYFLFVGTLEPRKNIAGLIEAYHLWKNSGGSGYRLVIVGKKGWYYDEIFETVKRLDLQEEVLFTGYVDEDQKAILLRHAHIFLYPSFYEGFGIPIVEAMGCGVPVITGNVSSLPEVAGEAGVLVNPNRPREMAEALTCLLGDNQLYSSLSHRSRSQAATFTWEKTARETLDTIKQLLAKEPSS